MGGHHCRDRDRSRALRPGDRPRRHRPGHHAARFRRPGGHAPGARPPPERAGPVPDGQGRRRGPRGRADRRRRRLRHQALLPGGGRGPTARPAAPLGGQRGETGLHPGGRGPAHGRGLPRGLARRGRDPADRHRVRAAALPHAQPPPGPVQAADPGPGVELRLRRAGQYRRALHLLPAPQDRQGPRAHDPHDARRRIRPQAGRRHR